MKVLPARQKAKKVLKNGNIVDKNSADSVWLIAVNQYTMMWTPKIKSLLPSLYKRSRLSRDLAKRGGGRFPETYVFFIMDSLVTLVTSDHFRSL